MGFAGVMAPAEADLKRLTDVTFTGGTEFEAREPLSHDGIYAVDELGGITRETVEAEARELIRTRDQVPKVVVQEQEYQDNARTALMEALTASGHLSVVELSGEFEETNTQVLRRLLNGWDESLPQHEQARRFAEICNELFIQKTFRAVVAGRLPSDTEVLELSDHPEALLGHKLGYRDSNRKGMARSTSLRYIGGSQYVRVIEQVSRSNGTAASTFKFLDACRIRTRAEVPADIAALEKPALYCRADYPRGIVDIIRRLDWHAGPGVLYGDSDERTSRHPAYEALRQESIRREKNILPFVERLAALEQQLDGMLAEGRITYRDHNRIYMEQVERALDAICTLDPGYAEDTFGGQSVAIFEAAATLVAQGRRQEAEWLLEQNSYLKQEVTFCGMTISVKEAKEMGLKVDEYGELVEAGAANWSWKRGFCRVKSCPKPQPTEVGPCDVCRHCQAEFDRGNDPTRLKKIGGALVTWLGGGVNRKRRATPKR